MGVGKYREGHTTFEMQRFRRKTFCFQLLGVWIYQNNQLIIANTLESKLKSIQKLFSHSSIFHQPRVWVMCKINKLPCWSNNKFWLDLNLLAIMTNFKIFEHHPKSWYSKQICLSLKRWKGYLVNFTLTKTTALNRIYFT